MLSSKTGISKGSAPPAWDGCYPTGQASRLTGVPRSTLNKWKRDGLIFPHAEAYSLFDLSDKPSRTGYGLTDLTVMRLLRGLRDKRIDRKMMAGALRELFLRNGGVNGPAWRQAPLYLRGREVYLDGPDGLLGDNEKAMPGSGEILETTVANLFEEDTLWLVPERFRDHVVIDPEVMGGEPVVKNTRLMTSLILAMLKHGQTPAEIANHYAPIPSESIEKAIEYEHWLDRIAQP